MDMRFRTPRTTRGWVSLGIIVVVLLLGTWPVIALFDTNSLLFGIPVLMVWSIAILFIATAAMMIINRLTGDMGDIDELDEPGDQS